MLGSLPCGWPSWPGKTMRRNLGNMTSQRAAATVLLSAAVPAARPEDDKRSTYLLTVDQR